MRRGPRATPGRFRTRVITEGVTPSLHVDYKHTRIKQYHKEGRALRTETTINDTTDFGIGKRLTNLPALREIGTQANRRLLRVQSLKSGKLLVRGARIISHHFMIRGQPRTSTRHACQTTTNTKVTSVTRDAWHLVLPHVIPNES